MTLLVIFALLAPERSTGASELSSPGEPAAEVVAAVAEPAPEPEPAPVEAETATTETEAAAPAEASAAEEAPVAEEEAAASTAAPTESKPKPEPEPAAVNVPDPVETAGDLVRATGVQEGSSEGGGAPVPAAVEVVASAADDTPTRRVSKDGKPTVGGSPADPAVGLERTFAVLAEALEGLTGPLGSLTPLEALNPIRAGEAGGPAAAKAATGPVAGRAGLAPVPGELLSSPAALSPERPHPVATGADPQPQAPTPLRVVAPSAPSELEGARAAHGSLPDASRALPPDLPTPLSPEGPAPAAKAASVGGPVTPLPPQDPSPADQSRAGSGAGGSIFIPLLGLLALLALAAPRGYRRHMAVRDFPVPTPFVCALERPG